MDTSLRKLCIAILATECCHVRKLRALEAMQINPEGLYVDMLDYVLDAIGVPADNTVEQSRKYGEDAWIDRADTFCRDWLCEHWYDVIRGPCDDEEAAWQYFDWLLNETEDVRRGV